MKAVLTLAAACVLACAALAADTTVRLGEAGVRFDRARWQASVSHDSISTELADGISFARDAP